MDPATVSVKVGVTTKLSKTVEPADATDKTGAWSIEDTTVATIDDSGTVTGVKAGKTQVKFTTTTGAIVGSATITVTTE
ncbi:Ig-like domain-containing protein [Lacticaseibacillus suibinensis]|uniref:Ig-like domain-containing protein n=1 Tax=Lacticaseibacillus suibinensis TaxID=2486011 RepID=UPI001942056F|nr:Ig-like domain-containing protein [Lacticaseibacillus suibinensis]